MTCLSTLFTLLSFFSLATEQNWIEEMEKSRRIVFVLSAQFLQENLCATVFSHSIRQQDHASDRNIYVCSGDIPDDLWDPESNEFFDNLETLKVNVNNARKSWLKVGRTLEWSGSYTLNNCGVLAADDKSAYQIEMFWKKLCLALPPQKNVSRFKFKPEIVQSREDSSTYSSSSNGALVRNEDTRTSDIV
jgi:hypothetical protein